MKKRLLLFLLLSLMVKLVYAQVVVRVKLPETAPTTTQLRAPNGNVNYTNLRTHFIIPASEATAGLINGVLLKQIGFLLTSGTNTMAGGQIKIYLQNTTDVTNVKSTTWATAITGMAEVYSGSFNLPTGNTAAEINLTMTTPFTYAGAGLYVAYEYTGSTFSDLPATYLANADLANATRSGASGNTTPLAVLNGISDFRPQMTFGYDNLLSNELMVTHVAPTYSNYNQNLSNQNAVVVNIKNGGSTTRSNFNVQLTVTGANPQTINQTVATLAAGISTNLTFNLTGTTSGNQQITINLPNDEKNGNNTMQASQSLSCNNMLRYVGNVVPDSEVGFGGASGIMTARYSSESLPISVSSVKARLSHGVSNIGNILRGVILNASGSIVATTPNFTITAGNNNTEVEIRFTTPFTIASNTAFYVGVLQTPSAVYYPIGTSLPLQTPGNRYFSFPVAGGASTELFNLGNMMIGYEATVSTSLNSSVTGVVSYKETCTFTTPAIGSNYTFKVNGVVKQTGSNNTYTYAPQNSDVVGVEVSRNGCTVTAPTITMQVASPAPTAGVLYVKKGATGNGSSWSNAMGELANALHFAKINNSVSANPQVNQIWVAKGIYKPLYSPADHNFGDVDGRNNAFLLVKDVKLYGGFDPENGIIDLATRNPQLLTLLSGDFNGNDVVSGSGATLSFFNHLENAYHVMISAGDIGASTLNGFTISGGNGNGNITLVVNTNSIGARTGAGMVNVGSSPTISNCKFIYNHVETGFGGAIFNKNANANINNCSFEKNKNSCLEGQGWGEESGGAMCSISSSPVISNSSFTGNLLTGSRAGGAIINDNSPATFSNVTISDNVSFGPGSLGGGMVNMGVGPVVLTNVVLSGNNATVGGGAIYNSNSSPGLLSNVLITGNTSANGAAMFNHHSSPILTNSTIVGNLTIATGAIYNRSGSTPEFNNTIVFGNSAGVVNNTGSDLPTYKNCLVQGLTGTGLIGFNGVVGDLFVSPLSPGLSNGGDYRVKLGSPLVNAGNQTLFIGLDATTKDLAGYSRLKGSNIDLGAYELQSLPQTINPIATITKTYGDSAFEPGGTSTSNLQLGYISADNNIAEAFQDAADGNKWKINIKKAGTVNITASQVGDGSFEPATPVVFSLQINKKPVNINLTSNSIAKTYDGTATATITLGDLSFATGNIVGSDQLSISLSNTTAAYDNKNVGLNKTISIPLTNLGLEGPSAGSYEIGNTTAITASVGKITARALTVKANNQTKTYDGGSYTGGNGVAYIGFALGDNEVNALSGTLAYEGTAQGAVNTGNYAIVPKGYVSSNYQITYINGNLLVTASVANILSFNAQTAGATLIKTYGDGIINASAVASSNLSARYGTSNPAVASINAQGQIDIKGTGTAVITANQSGDVNYEPASAISFTLQVNKKTLDVKANDYSKTFNGIPYVGGNGLSYTGFAYGENSGVLGGTISYTGNSQGALNTGNYQLIPSGLTANNYELNYIAGTLNIVPSDNNVLTFNGQTAGANLAVTYGNGIIDASATASSGLAVNYASSNPAIAQVSNSGMVSILSAGSVIITATQPGDGNQVAAPPISFTITVQQKALTITANNATKTYNGLAYTAGNGVSYTGFVTGENEQNLQGGLSYLGTAIGATAVGSYFIRPTGYSSNNYAITYQDGSLTVVKANLTITADAKTKVYGDTDPALTYKVATLVGSDMLTGSLSRAAGENIETYAINIGSLTAGPNYAVTYIPTNFAVTPKPIVITADAKTKVYGDTDPALTYKVATLVGSDALTGNLTRTAGENSGTYTINIGSLTAGANYAITYHAANLNISKAPLLVTAENKQACEYAGLPIFSLAYAGFKFTDNTNSLSSRPIVSTTANNNSVAGNYNLTPSGGLAANYNFQYVNGIYTVYAKPVPTILNSRTNSISRGETLSLTATGGTTYAWSNADGIISGQLTGTLIIRPSVTTTYIVTVGNANGCSETTNYTVEVRDDLQAVKANNILTPNGDGINDLWIVENIDMYPNNQVMVFDKAGRVLFTKKGYKNTWDGIVNGAPLTEDTYFYIIDYGTGKPKQKGFITLVKQQ